MIPSVFLDKQQLISQELKFDIYYNRISELNLNDILEMAWDRGIKEAKKIKDKNIRQLIFQENILVETDEKSYNPDYAIFSDYNSGEKKITLYKKNIQNIFVPSIPDNYIFWRDYEKVVDLFLTHEYFHHLETKYIGLTSEIKKIQIKIGPFVLKRKLRALSEIAAHAFVKEFYDIW
ncbi:MULTISPECIES: hypothetical protein [Thermoanaerobacter]|jgi:hypothetical protein|uniref:Uncharacterized protein n=2 Tax=Thermoanaerobacter TaxID=1754 RepID=B0KC94_THEP3|nr:MULTISPECIES: hypothetical protein [Thermoanaerobacter]ABY91733.1 hypothetical protein Teth514_0423 [Thermoanaerobacter sp. X514]ABY95448.1 hypothetical protein Teth39_1812 [Thermoanaerobacter pseudethanolicus ATCC 33223]ADV80392.1 hypothetical protein Thebr_1859 [Thermoanaerobacter brockii subsp. finnii Ako-1]HBW59330.1 hypothetical protein [Thermoanaerobacter sp.]